MKMAFITFNKEQMDNLDIWGLLLGLVHQVETWVLENFGIFVMIDMIEGIRRSELDDVDAELGILPLKLWDVHDLHWHIFILVAELIKVLFIHGRPIMLTSWNHVILDASENCI